MRILLSGLFGPQLQKHFVLKAAPWIALLFILTTCAFQAAAQTATTGSLSGIVTDPTGAVVPKAEVQLINVDTNATLNQSTNESGQFVFPNLTPGNYRLTVKATGFATMTAPSIAVEVNKSTSLPITLEVGNSTQTVEVTSTALAELQTVDAQIGNTVSTEAILRLPTLQRNATELINLQPGVVAGGNNLNMRVSGAIDDQNTVTVDGFDITQSVVAGNTVIPTPADSVEEFRVSVADPNSSLVRGSGAQVTLVGRRGSNNFRGALYEYLQNSALNSNTWDNNRLGQKKAPIRDNRFGGRIGGPIFKNKTFFFANYEGRRFSQIAQLTRTVPTDTLKQGIVQFRDPNGNIEQFNLATSALCGTAANTACDPRGLGLSPSVKAQWALMPSPNLPGIGDGLNTSGYFANIPAPIQTDYGVIRLDHNFTEKLQFFGSYTYYRSITTGGTAASTDISIVNGNAQPASISPQRGSLTSGALTYQISPTLLNTFRFGYLHDTNAGQVTSPTVAAGKLNIPGSSTSAGPVALLIGSGVSTFIDSPIDMDTQRARYQANYNGDWQYIDDVTKIWGKHTIQAGAQIHKLPYTHVRADKVIGSITSLIATVDGDQTYLSIPAVNRPPTCGASLSTNCITSNNLTNWDRYYASMLGLVDSVSVLAVRDQNLQPLPLGTFLVNRTTEWAPYFYVQDSWRLTKSLTVTLGLSYGWQTAPTEEQNRQTVMINADSNQLINAPQYMQNRLSAALSGQIYNPTIGFVPVNKAHVPVYNTDYGDWAPRASAAWNPSATSGLLGKIMGDRKTVFRGGFTIVYDRSNTVQNVEIPMLGIGFDQNIIVQAPTCASTGPGGAGCSASAGSANPGLSSFRVGVDGTLPLPVPAAATSPVIPPPGYTETLSFQVDPNTKIGRSYNADFSVQREVGGGVVVEAAFIGRYSRRLPQAVNLASAPYMMVDSASGQSFAKAYDTIANALRAGQSAASIPAQPFFEDQFPGLAQKQSAASATAFIVARNSSSFANGNLGTLFINLATYRRSLNLLPFTNDQAQVEFMRTYIGQSNYDAGVVTVTMRPKRGLMVQANYTYSSALDDNLSNQNNAGFYANSFHPGVDYGPSAYDRHHVFNAFYTYDVPVGKGHRVHGNNLFNSILGGWYTSGIVTAWSGLPLTVTESSQAWGGATATIGVNSAMIPTGSIASTAANGNSSGCTLSGVGGIGTSAASGAGLNIFSNPCAVYGSFRYIQLSSDTRTGRANPMRGLPFYNFDARLGKDFRITERMRFMLSADFFNLLNKHNFATPSLSYTSPLTFGVITSTFTPPNRTNSARWIEIGARIEF
ncbi:MAG: carboxypeptidase regulatory-like domain-containing protein [Acidobacteriaceae bacterium]|nr:carboxypeptidase regulatory-like domain-containing protein [Acidobacteriaceae bacterium]